MTVLRRFTASAVATVALAAGTVVLAPAASAAEAPVPGTRWGFADCWVEMYRRDDGYVQARGTSSHNNSCSIWLQRQRVGDGGYPWTTVSGVLDMYNNQRATAYHWNGTDAASRVCLNNASLGATNCGITVW
ncbi:hypothetical protein [Kitasatospora sp. NBC_01539]|uniref:hypothetical protein n=1 Tax=Kitasatospora sp. NBC_01539 TaxID=2903577 RepID=UPI0038600F9D